MPRRVLVALLTLALVTACTIKEDPMAAPRDVAAPPADALKTASGLASKVLIVGLGTVHPNTESTVTVNYIGWTTEGKMVDASALSGGPATFKMTQVIPGWTEGVQLMVKGEKRRFWIPAKLAYGENPSGGNPSGMLVFDIELLEVR
jgi:FKBP-type peptidyl-prolyl cis-trans isomerase